MKINRYSWLAVIPMLFAACQDDIVVEDLQKGKDIYSLSCTIEGDGVDPLSRAQIQLGNEDGTVEHFLWNKGDSFTLYQKVENESTKEEELTQNVFTISNNYSEPTEGSKTEANFQTKTPAKADANYIAIYPSNLPLNGSSVEFGFQSELDFTGKTSEEVWKDYFKNNLFMMTTGTLSETGENKISFQHLCSLIRITYTNRTEKACVITRLNMGGDQTFSGARSYNLTGEYWGGGSSTNSYGYTIKELSVAAGESVDLYALFFPQDFGTGNLHINLTSNDNTRGVQIPIADIATANEGDTAFEEGKRYWFKLSETKDEMNWSKDFSGETVTIENPELSTILKDILGRGKVTIDEKGHAVMYKKIVEKTKDLNLGTHIGNNKNLPSLKGIEHFTNLETFRFRNEGSSLVDIDFSKNVKLKNLELVFPHPETLDLSKNVNLESLLLVGMPTITELDLSNNTKLTSLNCQECSIAELDITPLPLLTELYAGGQRDNKDLILHLTEEQMELWDEKWCEKNKSRVYPLLNTQVMIQNIPFAQALFQLYPDWVTLNEKNYALIEKKIAEDTKSLIFDGIKCEMETLKGIEVFKNLVSLSLNDCPTLKEVDLSKNKMLNKVWLKGNSITTLNVSGLSNLEWLYCYDNQITELDLLSAVNLKEIFCYHNIIEVLNLRNSDKLTNIKCGSQNINGNMQLILHNSLQELWEKDWGNNKEFNSKVYVEYPDPVEQGEGNSSGSHFEGGIVI